MQDVRIFQPQNGPVFLGLDVGSTIIKAALINEDGDILYDYYGKNEGSPITCGIKILHELYSKLPKSAYIANACTTGYGELLLKTAFRIEEGEIKLSPTTKPQIIFHRVLILSSTSAVRI